MARLTHVFGADVRDLRSSLLRVQALYQLEISIMASTGTRVCKRPEI